MRRSATNRFFVHRHRRCSRPQLDDINDAHYLKYIPSPKIGQQEAKLHRRTYLQQSKENRSTLESQRLFVVSIRVNPLVYFERGRYPCNGDSTRKVLSLIQSAIVFQMQPDAFRSSYRGNSNRHRDSLSISLSLSLSSSLLVFQSS